MIPPTIKFKGMIIQIDPDYSDTLFVIHGSKTIVAPFGMTAYYEEKE